MRSRRVGALCLLLARRALAKTGCMQPGYGNYDATADTEPKGACEGVNACVNQKGACANCQTDALYGTCVAGCTEPGCGNVGFAHPSLDQIVAMRVERGAIAADGDLSDWAAHPRSMRYAMPPFATEAGDVVPAKEEKRPCR